MTKPATIDALQARADEVSALLKILSHRNRLLVACDLMDGERSVGEIEAQTGVRQPVLSRELARLRAAGLVATRRESKQIFYRLADDRLASLIRALCDAFSEKSRGRRPRASTASRPGRKSAPRRKTA